MTSAEQNSGKGPVPNRNKTEKGRSFAALLFGFDQRECKKKDQEDPVLAQGIGIL